MNSMRARLGAMAFVLVATTLPAAAQTATAPLKDTSGKEVGQANLTQTGHGVLINLQVKGLPPGEHAFHVHAVGKCEAPFTSAGGHFNPDNKKHGILSTEGQHAGDMPNLHIPQSGDLTIEVVNHGVTLEKGKPNSLLDTDGSALIIHAGSDDYKTDPTGGAGCPHRLRRDPVNDDDANGAPADRAGAPARSDGIRLAPDAASDDRFPSSPIGRSGSSARARAVFSGYGPMNKRRSARHELALKVRLCTGLGEPIPVDLSDVSAEGAQLKTTDPTTFPQEFLLILSADLRRWCRVVWRGPASVGVVFIDAPASAAN